LTVAHEYSGRTVHEAVEVAAKELGLDLDDLVVEVLQEARPALLGFGGRDARVRVSRKPEVSDVLAQFATTALQHMGVIATAQVSSTPEATNIEIIGDDLQSLTASQGKSLDALELLISVYAQRQGVQRAPIVVDADGYRAQHEKGLVDAARSAADRVASGNEPVRMDPMGPRDRRVVHMALKDDSRVHTASDGEDDARHVVVLPGPAPAASSTEQQ
jgi:spoIIIJ-associated protein